MPKLACSLPLEIQKMSEYNSCFDFVIYQQWPDIRNLKLTEAEVINRYDKFFELLICKILHVDLLIGLEFFQELNGSLQGIASHIGKFQFCFGCCKAILCQNLQHKDSLNIVRNSIICFDNNIAISWTFRVFGRRDNFLSFWSKLEQNYQKSKQHQIVNEKIKDKHPKICRYIYKSELTRIK